MMACCRLALGVKMPEMQRRISVPPLQSLIHESMSINDTTTPWHVMFDQPPPRPVDQQTLRNHFKNVYKLKDEQVEFMIRSASQSLQTALTSAEQALASDNLCAALVPVAHSLKGLFLNMGEGEWASLARAMEQAAKAGQQYEYAVVVQKIYQGVSGMLA